MFRYRPLSSMFRIWRRKKEEPAYVEDGVEYYLSRATKRAIRQADRMMKKMDKLHRARSYNRPGNGHVHVVMETTLFRKSVRLMRRQGADIAVLETAIDILASGQELPPSFDDHRIQLKRQRNRVCRIGPDWLLIYCLEDDDLILVDVRDSHKYALRRHRDLLKTRNRASPMPPSPDASARPRILMTRLIKCDTFP